MTPESLVNGIIFDDVINALDWANPPKNEEEVFPNIFEAFELTKHLLEREKRETQE